ncbi:uncharacterized protein PF3D7_1120000-like [Erythrolamprus reginae]|uniref:uncharacterized protein PF3D7_1120000-like n=1 Tax=Erythrolamprus reginae TaxID=121349 RepID=UPI00396CD26B
MFTKEKDREKQPSLASIQETLTTLNDFMLQSQQDATQQRDEIKAEMAEMKVDTGEMKDQMKEIKQALQDNEERMKAVEEKAEKVEKRIGYLEDKAASRYRGYDESITHLEMQRASYGLRFQNVIEEKDEDLKAIMADITGKILQMDPDDIKREIDEVFRISNSYIRRFNLPREIHIKFVRKSLRDDILHWSRAGQLQHQGKEIKILKQIPRRVRETRRDYHFLTKLLIKENITFRWLIPQGLSLTWKSTRYKLENLDQARDFYENSGISEMEQLTKELEAMQAEAMGAFTQVEEQDQGARRKQPQRETKKYNK